MNGTALFELEVITVPLIGDEVKRILEIVFQISIFIVTSLFGIVVNAINITVYWKQGLRDSITLGFFILSISDLTLVISSLAISVCYILKFSFIHAPINFVAFHYVSTANLRQMAYSFSTLLTAFLSIERCCCVILPFEVKGIFTRKRTLIFILSMLLFHILCFAPLYATNQIRWMDGPGPNDSKILRVWFAANRKEVETFNFTLMSILTPALAQILVICSSTILIHGLRASSKFRQSATGQTSDKEESESGLTSRDTRLVKAMVFLGGILSFCNLPYLVFICALLLVPELNLGRAYHNTYSVMFSISVLLAIVNASANIFVYYNISNKYRQIFKETFCFKIKKCQEG